MTTPATPSGQLYPGPNVFPGPNTFPGQAPASGGGQGEQLALEAEFGGLTITVYTNDYRPLGRVADYLKASVTWEWLAPGAGEIQVPADHWLVPVAMAVNTTVVPVVVSVNGVPWSGRIASVTREHSGSNTVGTATVGLINDWAWLQSILAWTQPTLTARAQGVATPVTGKLATIACQMINDNVARLGVPVMAICPIEDSSAVTTITPNLTSLADTLVPAFKAQNWSLTARAWLPGDPQPVGYVPVTNNLTREVPVLTTPVVLIEATKNASKPWVRWSDSVGGIVSDVVSVEDPRAYRQLLGGSGQVDTRIYAEYIDTTLSATLGRFGLPEVFSPVQTQNGKDTVADVLALGPTAQVANAGKANVTVTIQDGFPWQFGEDYFVGDMPRVELSGVELNDKPIVSVQAADDAAAGLVFTPTIGDSKETATSDAMIVDVVQRIAAQVRRLQTGK